MDDSDKEIKRVVEIIETRNILEKLIFILLVE